MTKRSKSDRLVDLVGMMDEFIGRFGLDGEKQAQAAEQLQAVKCSLFAGSSKPSDVVTELATLRALLAGASGSELAAAAVREITFLLGDGE